MSFELTTERNKVAFHVRSGTTIADFDERTVTLVLDISSNLYMDLGSHGFFGTVCKTNKTPGNFSTWVALKPDEAVAVSGLTSCGAVLLANQDFSRVAAGHMSGDALFADGWAARLRQDAPHFLVWGTGPDGSRSTGGKMLMTYMKAFNISPARAPAVAACGSIALTGSGIAFAYRATSIDRCKRSGQAVRKVREALPEEYQDRLNFGTLLDTFNGKTLPDQYMLLYTVSGYVRAGMAFTMNATEQQKAIDDRGQEILGAYYRKLPGDLRPKFLKFEIFKMNPKIRL